MIDSTIRVIVYNIIQTQAFWCNPQIRLFSSIKIVKLDHENLGIGC